MSDNAISPIIAGMAAGVGLILIFALLATNQLSAGSLIGRGITLVTTADAKCAQFGEWASIADEGGFVAIRPFRDAPMLKPMTETPDRKPGLYEFVLAQNSTGYITMAYDSCSNSFDTSALDFIKSYDTRKHGIYRLESDDPSITSGPNGDNRLPPNDTGGVRVFVSETTAVNEHHLIVTYTIEADSNAQKGLYIMNLYHTCPGELLTIGDKPHEGAIPWVNGAFYGCSF